jgi:hypothetical protein
MGGSLVITDFRPFFFRVIEIGRKMKILSANQIKSLREEGVRITIQLAKRQYRIISEPDLWQASYNVCGILSIALRKKFDEDLIGAAQFLSICGLNHIFRIGWQMTQEIIIWKNKLDVGHLDEKDFCELMSAEPETENWVGWEEYSLFDTELTLLKMESDYLKWMYSQKWLKKPDPEISKLKLARGLVDFTPEILERMRISANTYFFSLFISEEPFAPLKYGDLLQIISQVEKSPGSLKNSFLSNQKRLRERIPKKWHSLFDRSAEKNLSNIGNFNQIKKSKHRKQEFFMWMTEYLYVDININEVEKRFRQGLLESALENDPVHIIQKLI